MKSLRVFVFGILLSINFVGLFSDIPQAEDYYRFLMQIASSQQINDEIEGEVIDKISKLGYTSEAAMDALLQIYFTGAESVPQEFINILYAQELVDQRGKPNSRHITALVLQALVSHAKRLSHNAPTKEIQVPKAVNNFLEFMTKSFASKTRGAFQETLLDKFKFSFPGYKDLLQLFLETFIEKDYQFKSTKSSPFIIDCGSNLGMSLLFFKTIFPDAEILAFEPSPSSFTFLTKNIKDNNLTRINVVNKALSNKKGECFFQDNTAFSLCSKLTENKSGDVVKVESVLLSEYIKRPVDFLKMDVEGAEISIFQDLDESGKINFIKEMVIECHGLEAFSFVLNTLNKNGFKSLYKEESIWGHSRLIHAYSKYITKGNA